MNEMNFSLHFYNEFEELWHNNPINNSNTKRHYIEGDAHLLSLIHQEPHAGDMIIHGLSLSGRQLAIHLLTIKNKRIHNNNIHQ